MAWHRLLKSLQFRGENLDAGESIELDEDRDAVTEKWLKERGVIPGGKLIEKAPAPRIFVPRQWPSGCCGGR